MGRKKILLIVLFLAYLSLPSQLNLRCAIGCNRREIGFGRQKIQKLFQKQRVRASKQDHNIFQKQLIRCQLQDRLLTVSQFQTKPS